jgi:deazaflavin-dependent oxidoreductase (nitroreductase family)
MARFRTDILAALIFARSSFKGGNGKILDGKKENDMFTAMRFSHLAISLSLVVGQMSLTATVTEAAPVAKTAIGQDQDRISEERPLLQVAQTRSGRNDFNQKVITEFRANQGKVGGQFANRPLLLLTTTGAKSGKTYTHPLAYTKDGDRFVVIASFGGGPKNPSWYHNLVTHPEVTVEVGSERFKAKATVPTGDERQRLYDQQAKQMPAFAEYAKKTTRQIPVIVLTRIQ